MTYRETFTPLRQNVALTKLWIPVNFSCFITMLFIVVVTKKKYEYRRNVFEEKRKKNFSYIVMILYNSCICSTLACCNGTMYIEPCTLHNVQYTMFNVQCTNLGKKIIKMGWKNERNCIFSPQLVKSMHIFFPIWLKIYTKIEKKSTMYNVQCTMYKIVDLFFAHFFVHCTKLLTFFLPITFTYLPVTRFCIYCLRNRRVIFRLWYFIHGSF